MERSRDSKLPWIGGIIRYPSRIQFIRRAQSQSSTLHARTREAETCTTISFFILSNRYDTLALEPFLHRDPAGGTGLCRSQRSSTVPISAPAASIINYSADYWRSKSCLGATRACDRPVDGHLTLPHSATPECLALLISWDWTLDTGIPLQHLQPVSFLCIS